MKNSYFTLSSLDSQKTVESTITEINTKYIEISTYLRLHWLGGLRPLLGGLAESRETGRYTPKRACAPLVRRDENCCIKARQRRFVVKSAAEGRSGNFPRKKRGWKVPRSTPLM